MVLVVRFAFSLSHVVAQGGSLSFATRELQVDKRRVVGVALTGQLCRNVVMALRKKPSGLRIFSKSRSLD